MERARVRRPGRGDHSRLTVADRRGMMVPNRMDLSAATPRTPDRRRRALGSSGVSRPRRSRLAGTIGLMTSTTSADGKTVTVLTATGTVDSVLAGYIEEACSERPTMALRPSSSASTRPAAASTRPAGSSRPCSMRPCRRSSGSRRRRPCGERGHVHHAGGEHRLHGAGHEHRRGVAGRHPSGQDLTGTKGEKVLTMRSRTSRRSPTTRGRNVDWAVSHGPGRRRRAATRRVELGAVDGIAAALEDGAGEGGRPIVRSSGQPVRSTIGGAPGRAADEPVPGVPPPAVRPEHRVHPVHARLLRRCCSSSIHPNFVTGIIGALALVLAFIGFGSLPLNIAGLLLHRAGRRPVRARADRDVSHGLLAIGGIVCFVLGASALYTAPGHAHRASEVVAGRSSR